MAANAGIIKVNVTFYRIIKSDTAFERHGSRIPIRFDLNTVQALKKHLVSFLMASRNCRLKRGALGFSVFRFWSFLRSVFRFLHSKSSVFRFWYPLRFSIFSRFDIRFSVFILIKTGFFGFCYSLVKFIGLVISPWSIHFRSRRPVTYSGPVVTFVVSH